MSGKLEMAAQQGQKLYAAWNAHSVELVDAATVSPVLHLAMYRQGPLSPFTTFTTRIMRTTLYTLTTVSTHHSCHTHHSPLTAYSPLTPH